MTQAPISAAEEALIGEIISMYHTTRLDSDPVPHVAGKSSVRKALDAYAAAAVAEREAVIVAWLRDEATRCGYPDGAIRIELANAFDARDHLKGQPS